MQNEEEISKAAISRKQFLQRAGATGAGFALGGTLNRADAAPNEHSTADAPRLAQATRENTAPQTVLRNDATAPGHQLNVRDFGARGDGKTDDTHAFQNAINEAGTRGGGTIVVSTGRYLIAGHLELLPHVTLRGTLEAPDIGMTRAEDEGLWGSVLLAVEGAGHADGTPFITMQRSSVLRGLIIYYPEQKIPIPVAYPWTVRGHGDNISIIDCLFVNPYQAVDFGTHSCYRHYIFNLNAQALYRGVFVDQCHDIGRLTNVHFWPFWRNDSALHAWMQENAVAFSFGRTDWQFLIGCFSIYYKTGYHFADFGHGGGNVLLTNSGADVAPVAAQFDDTQSHSGVTFVNAQMNGTIQVAPTNSGPVRFVGCGFFGYGKNDSNAITNGRGRVSFDSCHFTWWDQNNNDSPAIRARGGVLGVTNCEFFGAKNHIALESGVRAANIVGNHFRSTRRITNRSRGQIEMLANTDEAPLPPVALKRVYFNGFEVNEPQPQLKAEVLAEPGKTSLRVENGGHSGKRSLVLHGEKTARENGHGAAYYRVFEVKIPVNANTVLRYWMKPENAEGMHCGLDLVLDNGKGLRDTPAFDTEDRAMHPAASRGEIGQWSRIESHIGRWIAGRTITAILVAHDNSFGKDAFRAAFDDIEIGVMIDE